MALQNAETRIPKLLLDYVESRRVELGLPVGVAEEGVAGQVVLPFVEYTHSGRAALPCVVFGCAQFALPHPKVWQGVVHVDVRKSLGEAGGATDSQEDAWVTALRQALSDVEALALWLGGLTEEERTGWRLRKYRMLEGGTELDGEKGVRVRRTALQVHVWSGELG